MKREIDLLFGATKATTDLEARLMAREMLALAKTRRDKHFVENDASLAELEDIFLTMEGSAQWLGYQWLIDPKGGNQSQADAFARFAFHSDFWSQNQGLAMFLLIDRFDKGEWKKIAFGDGGKAGLALLEEALARGDERPK
jgi:hypothetical protein